MRILLSFAFKVLLYSQAVACQVFAYLRCRFHLRALSKPGHPHQKHARFRYFQILLTRATQCVLLSVLLVEVRGVEPLSSTYQIQRIYNDEASIAQKTFSASN